MNQLSLVGHLTRDPQLRTLSDGRAVCDLRLAVNGGRDSQPIFIDIVTFGSGEPFLRGRSSRPVAYLAKTDIQGTLRERSRPSRADGDARQTVHERYTNPGDDQGYL